MFPPPYPPPNTHTHTQKTKPLDIPMFDSINSTIITLCKFIATYILEQILLKCMCGYNPTAHRELVCLHHRAVTHFSTLTTSPNPF